MGASPQPDPCSRGCVFYTFVERGLFYGLNALEWWSLWSHVSREHKDPKSGKVSFAIDYASLDTAFSIFGIEEADDKRETLAVLTDIAAYHAGSPLTREQMYGWEDVG